ncbi:MAG: (deoxy)nucleoside triphosphate pyrophosphohydrolase [Candidatus Microbacterium stercoravium]
MKDPHATTVFGTTDKEAPAWASRVLLRPVPDTCKAADNKIPPAGSLVKKQINVVGAVIAKDGKVLCAQRGKGPLAGLWEFPGGKIEPDESARDALKREITEELLCTVTVGDEITTTTHEYNFGIVKLTTFLCELIDGSPALTEHTEVRWLKPAQMNDLAWAPADIPAVDLVRERFME